VLLRISDKDVTVSRLHDAAHSIYHFTISICS
jgi:hypothetical protein